ncbi:MAG TPA: helix-turn-helix transcriptional regulator, partial [Acidimicrobiales bacterium]|nr:helix-turn-helix transcriptional regulator [Acidimicrobiales bacterium]
MAARTAHREDGERPGSERAEVLPFRGLRSAETVEPGSAHDHTNPSLDDPRWSVVLGDVLRDERRRQQRALADVAERAAVSLPYLSEVERGRKEISSDLLAAVITSLEVDLATVLE